MKESFIENGIEYVRNGYYYIPNLTVSESNFEIRKYGRMRDRYLRTERRCLYSYLMISGKLLEHLHEVDKQAQEILDQFIKDAEKTAQDVINYTENPSKTEERLYVTGINVSPDIARDQMVMTKLQYGKMDKILAYHGYQSFLPGEVTPDLAHEIGVELARRLWGDRFQVLVTTHLSLMDISSEVVLKHISRCVRLLTGCVGNTDCLS